MMRRLSRRPRLLPLGLVVLLLCLELLLLVPAVSSGAGDLYEDVSFALFPSAERAFAYGSGHFDARESSRYDLARAEMFKVA